MSKDRAIPAVFSLTLSVFAWLFVGLGTSLLFFIGLFIFFPASVILENANGYFPHRISQFWARMIELILPFWEIRVEGLEHIGRPGPYVIVSNHQSLLDILIVLASLPLHFKFIAKSELFWIPFFGWHLWLARYIPLRRGDPESGRVCLAKAREWLRRDVSVLFFPEGTRSCDGEIQEFKPGAFKLAIEEKINILPLVIAGTRDAIPKDSWRIEGRSALRLQIQEPISVRDFSIKDLEKVRDEVRSQMITGFEKLNSR